MNTKGYCTEALGYKCVHVRDIDWMFLFNQLVQLAKPGPVRPPGLGGDKAVCPLLSPPAPLQLRRLTPPPGRRCCSWTQGLQSAQE